MWASAQENVAGIATYGNICTGPDAIALIEMSEKIDHKKVSNFIKIFSSIKYLVYFSICSFYI